MGVALALVWQKSAFRGPAGRRALGFFIMQGCFNLAWSPLFFGAQWIAVAFVDIVLLWFAIDATIYCFAKVHRIAAWLLVPYWAWVTYAGYLNAGFLGLN